MHLHGAGGNGVDPFESLPAALAFCRAANASLDELRLQAGDFAVAGNRTLTVTDDDDAACAWDAVSLSAGAVRLLAERLLAEDEPALVAGATSAANSLRKSSLSCNDASETMVSLCMHSRETPPNIFDRPKYSSHLLLSHCRNGQS